MRVEVHFYGFVRDIVGTCPLLLEAAKTINLRDLLDLLTKRFGERLRERLLTAKGELEANVRVFVGNNEALSLDEPLGDGEKAMDVKIFVVSATAGG